MGAVATWSREVTIVHLQRSDLDQRKVAHRPQRVDSSRSRRKGCLSDHDIAIWQQVYPYLPDLYVYLGRQSLQHCDKEDILQETMLRIWARSRCEEIVHPKSYLFQVAKSVLIDRARRASVRQGKSHCALEVWHEPVDPLDPGRIVLAREELTLLTDGVNKLPQRTRAIFVGARVEGKCIKALAEDFGISVSAVEKHLSRALASLTKLHRAGFPEGSSL